MSGFTVVTKRLGIVEILPNTKRLKQLIREHGEFWECVQEPRAMVCFDGEVGMLIRSIGDEPHHVRNIRMKDIKDTVEKERINKRAAINYAEQVYLDQQEMFRQAQQRSADINRTFMEMLNSGNPLTKPELRKLIELRPEVWGRFEAYLETDVLPEE